MREKSAPPEVELRFASLPVRILVSTLTIAARTVVWYVLEININTN